jgi:hypothetical protein
MHQNAPGLQFLKPGGRTWLDAPVKKEEFVVNLGQSWPPSSKKNWAKFHSATGASNPAL